MADHRVGIHVDAHFDKLQKAAKGSSKDLKDFKRDVEDTATSVEKSSAKSADSHKQVTDELGKLSDAQRAASESAGDYTSRLSKMTAEQRAAEIASVRLRRAQAALTTEQAKYNKVVSDSASSTDKRAEAEARLFQRLQSVAGANDDLERAHRRVIRTQSDVGGSGNKLYTMLKRLGGGFGGVAQSVRDVRTVFGLLKIPVLIAGIQALIGAVSALAAGAVALVSAMGPMLGIFAALPGAIGVLLQSIGVLVAGFAGIGDAVKALIEVEKQDREETVKLARAKQDSARKIAQAQEAVSDAVEAHRDAEEGLRDAQEGVRMAQEALTEAREDATRTLGDLRREAERYWLTEEQAQLSLIEAEKNMQETLRDSDATDADRRQAQLAYQEALWAVADTKREGRRLEDDLQEAEKKGVANSDAVRSAREALTDAIEAQRDAQEALRDSVTAIADAQVELARAMEDSSLASDDMTSAGQKLNDAMEDLSPAGRRFARILASLRPEMLKLRHTAQEGLLPGVGDALLRLRAILPTVRRGIKATAEVFGELARGFADMLVGREGDLDKLFQFNAEMIERGGTAFTNLSEALIDVMMAARPLLRWVADLVVKFSEWARETADLNRKNGDMRDFFQRTMDVLSQWGRIIRNIAGALIGTGRAGQDMGNWIVDAIERMTAKWNEWANSLGGQNAMKKWFESAKDPLAEAARLVGALGTGLFNIGGKANEGLGPLLKQIREQLLPALERVFNSVSTAFGPEVVTLLTHFADIFAIIGGQGGTLTIALKVINKFLGFIKQLIDDVPAVGAALRVAFVGQGLLIGIGAITGALGGAVSRFGKFGSAIVLTGQKVTDFARAAGGLAPVMNREVSKGAIKAGKAVNWLGGKLKSGVSRVGDFASAFGTKLKALPGLTKGVFSRVATAVSGAFTAIAAGLKAFSTTVLIPLLTNPVFWGVIAAAAVIFLIVKHWDTVKEWLIKIWEFIKAAAIAVWNGIKAYFVFWFKFYKALVVGALRVIRAIFTTAWNAIKTVTRVVWNAIKGFFVGFWRVLKTIFWTPIRWIRDLISGAWGWIKDKTVALWGVITGVFSNFWDGLKTMFRKGVDALKTIWEGIKDVIGAPVEFVVNTIVGDWLVGNINKVLGVLPGDLKLPVPNVQLNRGGRVPGVGNRDTVPAMLTPGEFVIRKKVVERIGVERLEKLNRGAQRFAEGGLVTRGRKLVEAFYPKNDPDHQDHAHFAVIPEVLSLARFIVSLGKGFRVTEGPAEFGPVTPGVHSPTGYHYTTPTQAIDVNWGPGGESDAEKRVLNQLGDSLVALYKSTAGEGGILGAIGAGLGAIGRAIANAARSGVALTLKALRAPLNALMNTIPGAGSGVFEQLIRGGPLFILDSIIDWVKGDSDVKAHTGGLPIARKGTDFIRALLTPGEFVVNKEAAESFGYDNLWALNAGAGLGDSEGGAGAFVAAMASGGLVRNVGRYVSAPSSVPAQALRRASGAPGGGLVGPDGSLYVTVEADGKRLTRTVETHQHRNHILITDRE